MRRTFLAGLLIAVTVAATASATQPISPFDDALWTKGKGGFNSKMNCLAPLNCFIYTVMMNQVSIRGPEAAPTTRPKVGERFYVRTELALLSGPWAPVDTYRTKVILPAGVTPSISAPDDVICAITWTDDTTVRIPGPAECQDPSQLGVEWVLPAVSLDESSDGQVAQFWFPVVANRAIDGEIIQVSGTAVSNPLVLLPNPILAEVPLYVDASAAAPAPGPGATPTAPTGTGSATTPLAGVVVKPGGTGLSISWPAATAPGVTAYRVQARLLRTRKWINVGTAPSATTTLRWRKAKRGKRYQVRVAAIIGGVVGAWSKPVTVTAR